MRLRYRLLSIILVLAMLISCMVHAIRGRMMTAQGAEASLRSGGGALSSLSDVLTDTVTLRLWYTDPALTEYLNYMAVAWHEAHEDVRIRPELVSAIEYLEAIQAASVSEDEATPDLFFTTNDTLEKAYLAGLASPIPNLGVLEGTISFAASDAVTYHGNRIAYPYYFETAALLYNRTYLEEAARDTLEDEALQEGAALVGQEVPLEEADVEARIESYIPHSIADIMTFAESYNAPETVEAVFEWDVNDVFNNYFFVGEHVSVGGEAGDDIAEIDIYNTDAIRGMQIFQQMNQFFAIDADEVNSDTIIEDFIAGKTVFTLSTTDAVRRITEAQASGDCIYEYGAVKMPELTSELSARPMSVTNCIVVNAYSEEVERAHEAALFMTVKAWGQWERELTEEDYAMMRMSGKCAAGPMAVYTDEMYNAFYESYEDSVPVSKMLETSNFWIYLEIAFTDVWNGADPNDTMKALSERIMTQVAGAPYTEERLPDPPLDTVEWMEEN